MASAVERLTAYEPSNTTSAPYGMNWDLLWLGHCGDNFPEDHLELINDTTLLPRSQLQTWNKELLALPDFTRVIHRSLGPICSFGYAVSWQGAQKLVGLLSGMTPTDEGVDVTLSIACRGPLKCITVNPELFHHHRMAGHLTSEIGSVNGNNETQELNATSNIRYSARCNSGFDDEHLVQCLDKEVLQAESSV